MSDQQPDLFTPMDDFLRHDAFYNTIHLKGEDLKDSKKAAQTQEDAILAYFAKVKKSTSTAASLALGMNLNSARRAITNLCKAGKLIKTDEMRIESFGKPNHLYQYL